MILWNGSVFEHNIDFYFLLKSIYLVTGEKYYFNKGEQLKKSINKVFWDRERGVSL